MSSVANKGPRGSVPRGALRSGASEHNVPRGTFSPQIKLAQGGSRGHDVSMLIPWNGETLLFSTLISLLHTIYHCHRIAIRIMLRSSLDSPKTNGTGHRGSQREGRRGEDYDCH